MALTIEINHARVRPSLWGLPVIATAAMTQGSFLVGSFDLAAQIFNRMEVEILLRAG